MAELLPIPGLQSLNYHDYNGKLWMNSFARFTRHNSHHVTGERFNVFKTLNKASAEALNKTHTYFGVFECVHIQQIHYLEVTEAMAYMDCDCSLITWREMYKRMLHIEPDTDPLLDLMILQCDTPHAHNKRKERNNQLFENVPATLAVAP